jgi:hypothetical protein
MGLMGSGHDLVYFHQQVFQKSAVGGGLSSSSEGFWKQRIALRCWIERDSPQSGVVIL